MQVKKHLEADVKYLHKVRGSGLYSLTELADKLLPEVLLLLSACPACLTDCKDIHHLLHVHP